MFTGIIEELGEVVGLEQRGDSARAADHRAAIVDDLAHGASIAVNGVCLTVVGRRRAPGSTSTSWARPSSAR